ncbi:hypothetical protein BZG36_00889 [Bifiguratus adelaidae]|uniref:Methylated-DNA-[protein]-cysteine S-methyltransferase DNA binding domain-containing protein n=1 Tax=Bifiguratus adelaidae TaxID=1938954 RepID=A0A261Y5F0_9FUNG|nr:hypothetical protein BZG36_00889 [Bifiguratus adelaidae]
MSEESVIFRQTVLEIIRRIPRGRVTSYGKPAALRGEDSGFTISHGQGHVAKLAGYPRNSRQVGQVLKHLPMDEEEEDDPVPWQRVVNHKGYISPRGDNGTGARRQAERLREEDVEVMEIDTVGIEAGHGAGGAGWVFQGGGGRIDLGRYGWFPSQVDIDGEIYSIEA